jgi:tetratricopeptide (TPR) repeat protein
VGSAYEAGSTAVVQPPQLAAIPMRSLGLLLLAAAAARLDAQCAASTQRLITDQKYDEARAEVDAQLKKNPSDDAALHCMGMIYVAMDKSSDAIDWFEKAIKANGKSSTHHLWLGNALGEQASHTNKLKLPFLARRVKGEFDKAVELDPTSWEARHGLIQFYSQAPGVMGGSMDKAKEQAREIAKIDAIRGHLEMAALLERDKDVAGAEREFNAVVSAAPDSALGYNSLGNFYRRQKRYTDAVAVYEKLLHVKPEAVNAHLLIGWNLKLAGDNDRAERELKQWLSAPPKDAPPQNLSAAHQWIGDIYAAQSKKDAARAEYQLALQINPKNADAKKALENVK